MDTEITPEVVTPEIENQSPDIPGVPPVVETPAAVVETAPVVETPNPFFETLKTKFGLEVKSDEDFFGHFESTRAKAGQVDDLKAQLEAANSKKLEYQADASEQIDSYIAKLREDGVTDTREIRRKVRDFIDESSMDYKELANTDPVQVIEKFFTKSGDYTADQIKRLVGKEAALLDKSKYPDHLDEDEIEAMYKDNLIDLQIKAKGMATTLEEKKAQLDFKPKGIKSDEELQKEVDAISNGYADQANAWREIVNGKEKVELTIAGEKLSFTNDEVSDYWNSIILKADPIVEKITNLHTPEGFKTFQEMTMLYHSFPKIIAKAKEEARSAAILEFEKGVRNPGNEGDRTYVPGNEAKGEVTDPAEVRELFKRFPIT